MSAHPSRMRPHSGRRAATDRAAGRAMSAARKASRRRRRPPFEGKEKWAIDGARTRDIQDHNLALYQLSYDRHMSRQGRNPGPRGLGPPG
ncbi:MAG: hypothetical protein RLZZ187_1025 [Pseudomonadota bacterium]